MKSLLISALLLSAISAQAEPIYLSCDILSPNKTPDTVTLTLDENASTVVLTDTSTNKGKLRRVQAQYSANKVLFNHLVVLDMVMHYELDREAGTLTSWIYQDRPSTGPCTRTTAKRKF